MKEFIKINETRIRKSCIKKYIPLDDRHLRVYYSSSKNKPDSESFVFTSKISRNRITKELDMYFIN